MRREGTITAINSNLLTIAICQEEACQGCGAKLICNASNSKIKHIECSVSNAAAYNVGERVTVGIPEAISLKAVVLAFVIPLVLLFITLFIMESVGNFPDASIALAVLCVVALYYCVLYMFKERIKRKFIFNIEKQK